VSYIFFEHLGRVVKENRVSKGQTLRSAAEEIGISPNYLCDIENGNRIPTQAQTLTKLFKWMGKRYRGLSFEVTP